MTDAYRTWLNKALFHCRRGNLETERLLTAYAPVAAQSPQEQALFMALLAESDAHLFNWLLPKHAGQPPASLPIPERYRALIRKIRNNYLISNH